MRVAEHVGGSRRIVARLGSAHTAAEPGLLVEQARGPLEDAGRDGLDLDV